VINIFYIDKLTEGDYCIVYTKNNRIFFSSKFYVAVELNIIYKKYNNILIKHGADCMGCFKNQEDIEKCIEELEVYEIMNKLCE